MVLCNLDATLTFHCNLQLFLLSSGKVSSADLSAVINLNQQMKLKSLNIFLNAELALNLNEIGSHSTLLSFEFTYSLCMNSSKILLLQRMHLEATVHVVNAVGQIEEARIKASTFRHV